MNRYLVRQRFFKITDHFDIKDESGEIKFVVRSKLFTVGKKFWIDDHNGQELIFIKQRLFRLLPRFDFFEREKYIGNIKGRFSFFRKKLKVSLEDTEYNIKGNVFAWNFKIIEQDSVVSVISKSVLKIADTYTVDVYKNDPIVIAIAVVLDSIYHPTR